ncbi:hypothetical protein [Aliarcobacter butzleri]|uniref:hypothetical protein n=1 Tax=Aliarcobacter butzleri TaxID=28197 RepID=UPI002875A453|nr:hypothetical protein [Aliarcobacter butzleri]MDS1315730.1 hypothetical protein [Aliarcobacter butzleri]
MLKKVDAKMNLKRLNSLIASKNILHTYNYRKCAKYYEKLILSIIIEILEKHNYILDFTINNVKLLSEGSVLNSSTAIGYIIEEFLSRQIKNSRDYSHSFHFPYKTSDSAFDFMFKSNSIQLYCNIKAEKEGEYKKQKLISGKSSNKGIASAEAIYKLYSNEPKIPKLYLIIKLPYSIEVTKSVLILNKKIETYYLENFILFNTKADNRSWSKKNKKISGRLQSPGNKDMKKYTINTIPNYKLIRYVINNLNNLLK